MAPAKSMWLKMTPPKMVPRALVSRGSIVTRRVGSRVSVINSVSRRIKSAVCRKGYSEVACALEVCEPRRIFFVFPFDHVKEALLNISGNRTAGARADLAVIDFADGGQFGRRPGKKSFIRRIELVARKALLHHFIAFVAGDR